MLIVVGQGQEQSLDQAVLGIMSVAVVEGFGVYPQAMAEPGVSGSMM